MYCNKCHKQSPDNFITCAYCGARFNSTKKKAPHKFVKKKERKPKLSLKNLLRIFIAVGVLLVIAAVIVVTFTGSKPEKAVKHLVKAIEVEDKDAYYKLYDENIIRYKTDNHYFGEEETYNQIVLPLVQSYEFYKNQCGEDFQLTYYINSERMLNEEELEKFNKLLESEFGYMEFPTRVAVLELELVAEGELGEYKSVYDEFWCMKLKGDWYLVDKMVIVDYNNR